MNMMQSKKIIYLVISIVTIAFFIFVFSLVYATIKKISCYNLEPKEFYKNEYCEEYR